MRGADKSRLARWRHVSRGSNKAYVFAAFCVAIASLARWELGLIAEDVKKAGLSAS
jgi:hypothetical protein